MTQKWSIASKKFDLQFSGVPYEQLTEIPSAQARETTIPSSILEQNNTRTIVVVQPPPPTGNCPACQKGNIEESVNWNIVKAAVVLFPFGLLLCFWLMKKSCTYVLQSFFQIRTSASLSYNCTHALYKISASKLNFNILQ